MRPAFVVALLFGAALDAQVLQMERRAFAHLSDQRTELVGAWRSASPALRAKITEALESDSAGNPFLPTARALAIVRGVACDPEFVFRTAVHCFALPEILDPEEFQELSVTMHLPYSVPVPAGVRFLLNGTDASGKPRALARIESATGQEDLERFRAVATIPVAELGGVQRVEAKVAIGERGGVREADPVPGAPVQVVVGFKKRVEALRAARAGLAASATPRDLALLDGTLSAVERVWSGEPRTGACDPLAELTLAEHVVGNLAAGRAALAGVARGAPTAGLTRLTLGLRAEEGVPWTAAVELREGEQPARSLVVVLPGPPFWPTSLGGPSSPQATPPGLVLDQVLALGADRFADSQVVVLESPGKLANPASALPKVCAELRAVLGLGDQPLLLVAEREGATVTTLALARAPRFVDAVILVEGGSFQPDDFERIRDLAVLGVAAKGRVASENLRRAARIARERSLASFALHELDALPRDIALAVALDHGLPWFRGLDLGTTSRPTSR